MGIKYSQSESQELMKKLLANVAVADNITNRYISSAQMYLLLLLKTPILMMRKILPLARSNAPKKL